MGDRLNTIKKRWRNRDFWTSTIPGFLRRRIIVATLPPDIYWYHFRGGGCDIPGEDWDNLYILDCCRYDAFSELCPADDVDFRISKGSSTSEFVRKNFADGTYYDTVYVTANPHVERIAGDRFHDVVNVWRDGWDEDLNTVLPSVVADAVRDADKKYPNKRIIGHFIQPHIPYIGPTAEELPTEAAIQNARNRLEDDGIDQKQTAYDLLEKGEVRKEKVWEAYMESLELAFEESKDLCRELQGKHVITADHGDLFGEFAWAAFGSYVGHGYRIPTKHLIKVPWWERQNGSRKTIKAGPPARQTETPRATEDVQSKLEQLGYTD